MTARRVLETAHVCADMVQPGPQGVIYDMYVLLLLRIQIDAKSQNKSGPKDFE